MAAQTGVPEITLTDPQNRDSAPSPAQSPIRTAQHFASGQPVTPPHSSASEGRSSFGGANGAPDTASSRPGASSRRTSPDGAQKDDSDGNVEAQPAMDPLSQHLLSRTNTPAVLPTLRRPISPDSTGDGAREDDKAAPAVRTPSPRQGTSDDARRELKRGVKAVTFLSRLVGNMKKESPVEAFGDDDSSLSDNRPEGAHAEEFAQATDSMGFAPQHAPPPEYIKVRTRHKQKRDFDRLFLAQQLYCRKDMGLKRTESNKLRRKNTNIPGENHTVWAMEFSKDGKYLAAAGADRIVRVWQVLSSADDRQEHERQETAEGGGAAAHCKHLSAPVFLGQPVREYEGHSSTVLDLAWSKNNFLLSSSMDKTVRLWHISRAECLCTFKHNDFVPSIAFHPKDDRFFLAGSLDSKLRLWSIPDKAVAYVAQLPDLITAVAFTPDGRHAMAGCLGGLCMFYETEGLKYSTQINVRSTRGQNAKGSKITGIQAHHSECGDIRLLITSNDSRIRLYNFRDKSLELKFKGNENNSSQIRATLSDDGRYVVCGSEDRKAYVWSLCPSDAEKRNKRPLEMFEAHDTIATVVCFAPTKTRQVLSKSEDPIYDLCNPPPVALMTRAQRAGSTASSQTTTENGKNHAAALKDEAFKKPVPSAAYVQRSGHEDGNIIVTADYTGRIKVFRQDCAWHKRKVDDWDRGSIFSKRGTKGSRQGSITTKSSQPSLREPRSSVSTSSDRILSWRNGIASNPDVARKKGENRSTSPRKSIGQKPETNLRSATSASDGSLPSTDPTSHNEKSPVLSQGAKSHGSIDKPRESHDSAGAGFRELTKEEEAKLAASRDDNPLHIEAGRSYLFWDTARWRDRAQHARALHADHSPERADAAVTGASTPRDSLRGDDPNHLSVRPPMAGGESYVSRLSDEQLSDEQLSDRDLDGAPGKR